MRVRAPAKEGHSSRKNVALGSRAAKRGAPAILSWPGTPLTFLLTGFTWLGISFLLGIALIIGLVYGTPLPR